MENRTIKRITLLLIFSMIFILVGCKEKSSEKKLKVSKNLIVAQGGEPETLDPHKGNRGTSLLINRQIYSRLIKTDENMNLQPDLAETWKEIDNKTMEFKLRKGVKFHNGELLTPEDIVFSFERMKNSPRISFIVPPIEKVEIIDKDTIRVITSKPFAPLLYHLAHPALGIVSKKTILGDKGEFIPNGTGPYKFKEWKIGERLILERNNEYFLKKTKFETIVFKNILEGVNRAIALETGEAHIAMDINPSDVKLIEKNKKLKILKRVSNIQTYIGMNNNKKPFSDERVRLAINYAIDKSSIINAILEGEGELGISPLASEVFGFTDKIKKYPLDLERAKKLLKDAGYEKGFKTNLIVTGGGVEKQIGEIIQSNLKKIGIELSIEVLDAGVYWEKTTRGDHELYLASWGSVTGDADYALYSLYHSSAKGAGNRDFYSNTNIDELLERGRVEQDLEKRKEIYRDIQELIMNDSPNVILYTRNILIGVQKWVSGLNVSPVPFQDLYTVYPEE